MQQTVIIWYMGLTLFCVCYKKKALCWKLTVAVWVDESSSRKQSRLIHLFVFCEKVVEDAQCRLKIQVDNIYERELQQQRFRKKKQEKFI